MDYPNCNAPWKSDNITTGEWHCPKHSNVFLACALSTLHLPCLPRPWMQHLGTGGKGTTYEPKSLGDRSDTNFLPCRVTYPPESLYITLLLSKHKLLANVCDRNLNSPQEYSFEVTILTCKKMSSNQPRGLLLEIHVSIFQEASLACLALARRLFEDACAKQFINQRCQTYFLTCLSIEK